MGSLISSSRDSHLNIMDAIRKKMKSLKDETDGLYAIIKKFEDETKESNSILEQAECDIRDYGKKVHGFEIDFDETLDKLNKANESYEEKDKMNITKLNQRIDDIEDEIYREKLKIKKVADELGDTFMTCLLIINITWLINFKVLMTPTYEVLTSAKI